MIDIRLPADPEEVRKIEQIQIAAWGDDKLSVTPHNTVIAWMHAGGIIILAYEDAQLIGFAASFPAIIKGKLAQWSHMTAVHPDYQRQGLGRLIKFAQRDESLKQGFDLIGWTYDPLRKANALFNIESLGVHCHTLHYEFYGQMTDGLNKGLLSDRFEVHWKLKDKGVKARLAGKHKSHLELPEHDTYVTCFENQKPSIYVPEAWNAPEYTIELPANLEALRAKSSTLVHEWNMALRTTATPLFAAGYTVDRVVCPSEETFAYVFKRGASWFLYVLETADGTYYTGITPDIEKRVAAHNAGRGAKYTSTRRPVRLLAAWETPNKSSATKIELRFKKLSRPQKHYMITSAEDFEGAIRIV